MIGMSDVTRILSKIECGDPSAAAELVKLRYVGGLTAEEAGKVLGLSPRTADRLWVFARSWRQVINLVA